MLPSIRFALMSNEPSLFPNPRPRPPHILPEVHAARATRQPHDERAADTLRPDPAVAARATL